MVVLLMLAVLLILFIVGAVSQCEFGVFFDVRVNKTKKMSLFLYWWSV